MRVTEIIHINTIPTELYNTKLEFHRTIYPKLLNANLKYQESLAVVIFWKFENIKQDLYEQINTEIKKTAIDTIIKI